MLRIRVSTSKPIDTRSHSLQWKLLRLEARDSSGGRMSARTAYTNVFLKCWVLVFCTIMERRFSKVWWFPRASSLSTCRTNLWLIPIGNTARAVCRLVGLISQFFCMQLRGPSGTVSKLLPRRSLTGQEILTRTCAEPAWSPPQNVRTLSGTFPQLPQPFGNFQSKLPVRNFSLNLAELPTNRPEPLRNAAGTCPQLLGETRYPIAFCN